MQGNAGIERSLCFARGAVYVLPSSLAFAIIAFDWQHLVLQLVQDLHMAEGCP
jgi:hypothetical protein